MRVACLQLPVMQAVARRICSQRVIITCQGMLRPQVCVPPYGSIPIWAGLVHPDKVPAGERLGIRKSAPRAAGRDLLKQSFQDSTLACCYKAKLGARCAKYAEIRQCYWCGNSH